MQTPFPKQPDLLFNFLLGLLPAVIFWLTTPWGVGAAVDSVRYYEMADIFTGNQNLRGLGTHLPPLYPFLISTAARITDDLPSAARIFQFILIAINVGLAAILVSQLTNGSRLASLIIALTLTLNSQVFFLWHYALSEALFSAFLLLHFLCLITYQRKNRSAWLFVAGLLLGAMLITRYAALPFIPASIVFTAFLCRHLKPAQILRNIGAMSAGISLLPLSWISVAISSGLKSEPRSLNYNPIKSENLQDGINSLSNWFSNGLGYIAGFFVVAVLVYSTIRFFRTRQTAARPWIFAFFLIIFWYLLFVLVSLLYFDAHIELEGRIFYPALILFLIAVTVILVRVLEQSKGSINILILLTLFVIVAGSSPSMYARALTRIHQGEGYGNALYRNMEVWKFTDRYAEEEIVSNGKELIRLHMQKNAGELPKKYNPITLEPNPDYHRQLKDLRRAVVEGELTLIYFAAMQWRDELPSAQRIMDVMQIEPDYLHRQVMIFHVPDPKN